MRWPSGWVLHSQPAQQRLPPSGRGRLRRSRRCRSRRRRQVRRIERLRRRYCRGGLVGVGRCRRSRIRGVGRGSRGVGRVGRSRQRDGGSAGQQQDDGGRGEKLIDADARHCKFSLRACAMDATSRRLMFKGPNEALVRNHTRGGRTLGEPPRLVLCTPGIIGRFMRFSAAVALLQRLRYRLHPVRYSGPALRACDRAWSGRFAAAAPPPTSGPDSG